MFTQSRTIKQILIIAAIALFGLGSAVVAEPASTQSASPLGNKDVGKIETAVGDLVADAVRAYVKSDVALIAASELKTKDSAIAAGKVSESDLTDLVSYNDDPLAVLQLTGAQLKQALEKAVSIYPQSNLGFLQVSGVKFAFDSRKDTGERVSSVIVGGAELDNARTYTVAVTNSMANGALGYWKVWDKDSVLKRLPDATIITTLGSYLSANPKIDYSSLDRISAK